MNKILITLTLGIFLISTASAMYSGENETFNMGFEIINCSIINNASNLEGLNWIIENTPLAISINQTYEPNTSTTNVTISTEINYKPDNFTISCWVKKYGQSVKVSSSSGGGGTFKGIKLIDTYSSYFFNGQIFKFQLNGEHKMIIKNITNNSVSLRIESDPIYFNLSIGENKKVDLEDDGFYDLKVSLFDITNNRANISLEVINEKIETQTLGKEDSEPEINKSNETNDKPETNTKILWVILLLILIVTIIWFLINFAAKGNSEDSDISLKEVKELE